MDFSEDSEREAIRAAVRHICTQFPDEYWAEADFTRTFPWAFYEAMAKGGEFDVVVVVGD